MIMIKYFLINFSNFFVIVSLLTKLPASVAWITLTFLTNLSCAVFLTTSFFTTSLSSLKSTPVVSNLSISNLSMLLCLKHLVLLKIHQQFFLR